MKSQAAREQFHIIRQPRLERDFERVAGHEPSVFLVLEEPWRQTPNLAVREDVAPEAKKALVELVARIKRAARR